MTKSERSQSSSQAMPLDEALDEALRDTFPASDAINLHQWTEMRHADPIPKPESPPPLFDRLATYLLGPTAFCA